MIFAEKYQPVLYDKYIKDYKKFKTNSSEYLIFWKEQKKRIIEGYKPSGGEWIPGNYYFYLNFSKIHGLPPGSQRKTMISPIYRDQDHEYFQEIHDAKKGGYGIIVLKARRKGFSFMNANILLHEWTCYSHSENGLGAQKEDYVQDFRKKLLLSYNELPSEFRNKILHNNEELLMSGYKEKEDGIWVEKGMKSMIHFRVMDKPNAFRGTSLNYMVFEEAGEFLKLRRSYQANEECFREGAIQFGTPIIGGTSNQMEIDSDDYMEMYLNPQDYNLKPIFISAAKVYAGFFDMSTGKSDIEGATKDIQRRALEKKEGNRLENYYAFLQEMPLKPEDAFVKTGTTPFNLDLINRQISNIQTNNQFKVVQKGYLDWPSENGKRQMFKKPVWRFAGKGDHDAPFEIVEHPLEGFKNTEVAAVDPYHVNDEFEEMKKNKDLDKETRSLGSMCVYRRFVNTSVIGELPVAFYTDRPETKEEFYENCAKLAIYYDCQILIEYNDEGFLKYFTNNRLHKYLKERPRSADSPYSQVTNRYGIHMKTFQKNLLVELLDEYIKKHYEDIYFLKLLNELAVFGQKNTDRAMAFGLALIHDMDNLKRILHKEKEKEEEKFYMPTFKRDSKGNPVPVNYSTLDNKLNNPKRNINFDYNFDD